MYVYACDDAKTLTSPRFVQTSVLVRDSQGCRVLDLSYVAVLACVLVVCLPWPRQII